MTADFEEHTTLLGDLNDRTREVFRRIVESYMSTGDPVGSRTLSRSGGMDVSAATIRNVMADLEDLGLLYAPHTSAGRLPTESGLRLYIDGLLEMGSVAPDQRAQIAAQAQATGQTLSSVLEDATGQLSSLSSCAGLVVAPTAASAGLRHVEFVPLGPGRALAILVSAAGMVENRVIEVPLGTPPSSLIEAGNYLSARLAGRSMDEARAQITRDLESQRAELDALTQKVVEAGLATNVESAAAPTLIVRGQSHLFNDVTETADLERIRRLFAALEAKENVLRLLGKTESAEGVQIFIGSQTELFGLSGCSMIVAPYARRDADGQKSVVGAVGVIGPMRMNYAQVIPMVDYTADVIGKILG